MATWTVSYDICYSRARVRHSSRHTTSTHTAVSTHPTHAPWPMRCHADRRIGPASTAHRREATRSVVRGTGIGVPVRVDPRVARGANRINRQSDPNQSSMPSDDRSEQVLRAQAGVRTRARGAECESAEPGARRAEGHAPYTHDRVDRWPQLRIVSRLDNSLETFVSDPGATATPRLRRAASVPGQVRLSALSLSLSKHHFRQKAFEATFLACRSQKSEVSKVTSCRCVGSHQ